MPGVELLRCVAGAVVANALPGLVQGVPFGNFLYQVAADALRRWREVCRDRAIRDEVEALAREGVEEAKQAAAEVAREVAAGQPEGVASALELYLSQVPAEIRRSLARPDDPTGTTLPAGVALDRPDDLLALLPARPPRFRAGDRPDCLRGEWELVELLGAGGFGEVWKGRHVDSPALVSAFKFCLDAQAQDRLLKHEAAVLSQVQRHGRHPGIVPLEDFSLRADTPWLRYEFVEGGDLTRVFAELKPLPMPRRVEHVVSLMRELAATVGHFHRLNPPVVHRDLKPANVLVSRRAGGGWACRVADFGIGNVVTRPAAATGGPTPSVSGVLTMGGAYTVGYGSPQQRRGERPDPRDDVYALGMICYQLLVADPTAETPRGKWKKRLADQGAPAALLDAIEACVDDDPAERPADGAILAQAFGVSPQAGSESTEALPKVAEPARENVSRVEGDERLVARDRIIRAIHHLNQTKPAHNGVAGGLVLVPSIFIAASPMVLLFLHQKGGLESFLGSTLVLLVAAVWLLVWGLRLARKQKLAAQQGVVDEVEATRRHLPSLPVAPRERTNKSVREFGWEAVRGLESLRGEAVPLCLSVPTCSWFCNVTNVFFDDRLLGSGDFRSGAKFELSTLPGTHIVRIVTVPQTVIASGEHSWSVLVTVPRDGRHSVQLTVPAFGGMRARVFRI